MAIVQSEFTETSKHLKMSYMVHSSAPNTRDIYADTPKKAAEAFYATYPRVRKPVNVSLVHEYEVTGTNGEVGKMARYGNTWPTFRNLVKASALALPDEAFEDKNKESVFALEFHFFFYIHR